MEPMYVYKAVAERVIDGDTYVLRVDLGFRCAISFEGRLHGVNCPEKNTEEGKQAKAFVEKLIPPNTEIVVQTYKDERTFARWVVDVWLTNGDKLADQLLSRKFAVVMDR